MHLRTFADKVMYFSANDAFKEYLTLAISASTPANGGGDNDTFKPTKQVKDVIGSTQVYVQDVVAPFDDSFYVSFGFVSAGLNLPVALPANVLSAFAAFLTDSSQGNYSYSFDSAFNNVVTFKVQVLKDAARLDSGQIATTLGNLLTNPIPT